MSANAETWSPLAYFDHPDALICGIGNVGRQDDGLGWAVIDWIEDSGLATQAECLRLYQLQLQDAELLSRKRRVLFVDATQEEAVAGFDWRRPQPKQDYSFSSHAVSVPALMATCQTCFGMLPDTYLLAIRGYAWELQQGLSPLAQQNLSTTLRFLTTIQPHEVLESTC